MSDQSVTDELLETADVESAVWSLRPDYRALLLVIDGLVPGPSDALSDAFLRTAEAVARQSLANYSIEELAHVAAWRDCYRAFGAKPQRTRNSLEALLRRVESGLPRVNRLTDTYNAVSLTHMIPVGGEDAQRYDGAPRLVRAVGNEPFDTTDAGAAIIEHPEPGEVIWRDRTGVTCRRWNWRQARRTQLRDDTTRALFIFDALSPVTNDALNDAAEDLTERVSSFGGRVRATRRILTYQGD